MMKWGLTILLHCHSFICSIFASSSHCHNTKLKKDLKHGLHLLTVLDPLGPCSLIAPCSTNPTHSRMFPENARPVIAQNIYNEKALLQRKLTQSTAEIAPSQIHILPEILLPSHEGRTEREYIKMCWSCDHCYIGFTGASCSHCRTNPPKVTNLSEGRLSAYMKYYFSKWPRVSQWWNTIK